MKQMGRSVWVALSVCSAFLFAACGTESGDSVTAPGTEQERSHVTPWYGAVNGNGNDNGGTNGNDNGGTNGNDNGGTNGNDNGGTNGNDNGGTNGNDNGGTNGNDNGGGSGTCPDGSTQLRTILGGSSDNDARYEVFPASCSEFRVRVRDLAPYTTYTVMAAGVSVGTLSTDDDGRGELRYQGNLPAGFPALTVGDQVSVGPVSGTFAAQCSSNGNCNG